MDNSSLAAQAVAMGPATPAPPSFDGHGWLVVINLAFFTAGAIIAAMIAWDQAKHIWRNRNRDFTAHPVTIWRLQGLLVSAGIALRCSVASAALWRWDPTDPAGTGWVLTLQRFVDPIALTFGMLALLLLTLSSRGMVEQLRREPLAVQIWTSLPKLKRPMIVLLMSLAAAAGVVSTR